MPTFFVCSESDSDKLQEIIKKKFDEDYYILRDKSQWLIDAEKTTKEIADELNIDEKLGVAAVVFLVSNYGGWHDSALWEWLELE